MGTCKTHLRKAGSSWLHQRHHSWELEHLFEKRVRYGGHVVRAAQTHRGGIQRLRIKFGDLTAAKHYESNNSIKR